MRRKKNVYKKNVQLKTTCGRTDLGNHEKFSLLELERGEEIELRIFFLLFSRHTWNLASLNAMKTYVFAQDWRQWAIWLFGSTMAQQKLHSCAHQMASSLWCCKNSFRKVSHFPQLVGSGVTFQHIFFLSAIHSLGVILCSMSQWSTKFVISTPDNVEKTR